MNMLGIKKIKLKKIGKTLKKFPLFLAKNLFLGYLGFLLICLAVGYAIFYYCVLLTESPVQPEEEELLKFDRTIYQEVLLEWQLRNERFLQIDSKEYSNPFLHQ